MSETVLPRLTEAETNISLIADCCRDIKNRFLELGGLLAENQDKALWSQAGYERFKDFVEMLGIGSYSWVTRLISISRLVAAGAVSREELTEIGVSKCCLLVACNNKGKLDEATKALARDCTFVDLQKHLGYNLPNDPPEEFVNCPRCGFDITIRKGMIQHR